MKLLMFQWLKIRNIHTLPSHFWYWFCLSLLPLFFFEYIIYWRLDIFLIIECNCIWKCEKMIWKESVVRETHLHLTKPNICFFENQEKLWKLLVVHCFSLFILSGYLFLIYKENWYFNNKHTWISYYMAMHFSDFHHHTEVFDYGIHLIFLNGFRSVTFVACIVHLINEIIINYIYII